MTRSGLVLAAICAAASFIHAGTREAASWDRIVAGRSRGRSKRRVYE